MFDNLVAAHGPSGRTRARTIVVTTSVLAHLAAVAVLAVLAIWKVDKVDLDTRGSRVSALTLPPRDSGGGGAPKQELVAKPKDEDKPKKVKPTVTVQPDQEIAEDQQIVTEAEAEGATGAGAAGTAPGNGKGGDGKGLDVPTGPKCEGAACLGGGTGGGGEEPKVCLEGEKLIDGKCVKAKVDVVPPDVARGLRKSGNDQIPAPQSVRVAMMRAKESRAVGTIKLCLGADGRVDRASVLKTTGYDAYDDVLLDEMKRWRYDAYTVDGDPVPFCTVVTVVYVMK